jgi:hypothetical protein
MEGYASWQERGQNSISNEPAVGTSTDNGKTND